MDKEITIVGHIVGFLLVFIAGKNLLVAYTYYSDSVYALGGYKVHKLHKMRHRVYVSLSYVVAATVIFIVT